MNRHFPNNPQIQGNRTTIPPPRELHPFRSQARGVEAVYAGHGLRREDRVELGEWVSLMLRKRGGRWKLGK